MAGAPLAWFGNQPVRLAIERSRSVEFQATPVRSRRKNAFNRYESQYNTAIRRCRISPSQVPAFSIRPCPNGFVTLDDLAPRASGRLSAASSNLQKRGRVGRG